MEITWNYCILIQIPWLAICTIWKVHNFRFCEHHQLFKAFKKSRIWPIITWCPFIQDIHIPSLSHVGSVLRSAACCPQIWQNERRHRPQRRECFLGVTTCRVLSPGRIFWWKVFEYMYDIYTRYIHVLIVWLCTVYSCMIFTYMIGYNYTLKWKMMVEWTTTTLHTAFSPFSNAEDLNMNSTSTEIP